MKKILFLITQSEMGGAQRFLLELAPYISSCGHEVLVAAGDGDDELFAKIRNSKSKILNKSKLYKIPNLIRALNPYKDIRAFIKILEVIKKEKPNILFLQSTKAGFLGSLAVKLYLIFNAKCKMQVVYRIGGWAFNDPRPWWMNQIVFWMEKISAKWKDVIIVNSEYDKKLAIEKKMASTKKIIKIYNGIDSTKLNFSSRKEARGFILSKLPSFYTTSPLPDRQASLTPLPRKGGRGGVLLVGTIANLYATKGIDYLVKAASILSLQILDSKFKILFVAIGEGPEHPKLEALIKKYNLQDKFFLIGRLPNAAQYLKAFDIFVLPSVKEGFPWAILEAMAAEIPIIATKVGAVPEVIEHGKDGFLIPPKNPTILAQKISSLVNIQNKDDRFNFVYSAKRKLEKFSSQRMLDQTYATLKL